MLSRTGHIIHAATLALALLLIAVPPQAASADDFERGLNAYNAGDYESAITEWLPLAKQGDAMAEFGLGVMYHKGEGVPQDQAEAAKWYRRAAEQGHASAQHNLGVMYDEGKGVPQDYAEAVTWYRRAAEQGHADAQNNLGFMHDYGKGVPQNYVLAHMWYNLAASQGDEESLNSQKLMIENRDRIARLMTPAQIAEAQALAARCRASDYRDCGD